jgi:hypothetical protein
VTKRRTWAALGVVVVVVLAGCLIALNPSIRCRATFGTWVPEHPINRVTSDSTYWLVYYAEQAHCA